jgi:hypothetical protein
MLGVVLCRSAVHPGILLRLIWISGDPFTLSHREFSSAALEISSDFGKFLAFHLTVVVLDSGISPQCGQSFGARGPGPISSAWGIPLRSACAIPKKGKISEVTPL